MDELIYGKFEDKLVLCELMQFRRCSFNALCREAKNVSHCLARQHALNRNPVGGSV